MTPWKKTPQAYRWISESQAIRNVSHLSSYNAHLFAVFLAKTHRIASLLRPSSGHFRPECRREETAVAGSSSEEGEWPGETAATQEAEL